MKQETSSLSMAIRHGVSQLAQGNGFKAAYRATLASYLAAVQTRTNPQAGRINTNPNATMSQMQRVQMSWDGENIVKNSDFGANYVQKRRMYCTAEMSYSPDTGDEVLNEELRDYLDGVFSRMGINCSMQDAFSRAADTELPMRGDSALVWVRDETQMRLMEVQADRIGELYNYYGAPDPVDGLNYYMGIFTYGPSVRQWQGRYAAFKIYERIDQWYGNPAIYPASDVLFFTDNLMAGIRGVTKFAQCLPIVGNRDMILYSTMQTMQQQSKIAAIASNNAGEPDTETYDAQSYQNGTVEYVERYGDGPVTRWQFNGDSYQVLKAEHPTTSFQLAMDKLDAKAARAIGFPYEFLMTPEDIGGAPSRFAFECAGKELTRLRNNVYRPRLNIISYVTIMDAIERGIFRPNPKLLRGAWNFGTLPSADAFRDDKSDIQSIRAGTKTRNDVTTANSGRPYSTVLRVSTQEAIAVAKATQDGNKQLTEQGYDPTITQEDIAQNFDNPQAVANAQEITKNGKTIGDGATRKTASLAAFMGDVTIGDLPESTRKDVAKVLGTNGHTDKLRAVKYGMVASELEHMADSHNLESAQHHIRYCTNGSCADEVHANDEKHILVVNNRVVDGHHYLAKALRGKVTKSLRVLDLTPARFQTSTAQLKAADEGGEWKTVNGRHILIKDGQSVEDALHSSNSEGDSKYHSRVKEIEEGIESVKDGKGSMHLYHGTRQENPSVHVGQTFADNMDTADRYSDHDTLHGEVDMQGLKVAKVKGFDRNDANYGAIGDHVRDHKILETKGIDVIQYEDEDPHGRAHTAYRVVSKKGRDKFEKHLKLASQEE